MAEVSYNKHAIYLRTRDGGMLTLRDAEDCDHNGQVCEDCQADQTDEGDNTVVAVVCLTEDGSTEFPVEPGCFIIGLGEVG